MSDVNVLRALADCDGRAGEPLGKAMRSAADEIERLQAELREAREILTDLNSRAKAVARLGATPGPQWVHLTGAGLRADVFLAK